MFNGDLGRIKRHAADVLIDDFEGREVEYPLGELDALASAYATTI